jgi:hypothetical protein
MIQHGNMMQLLLWHALSTLKDSLKEKAGRFPFTACCWAWSGRQWPESTPDCWWLWHLPNAHKHGKVLHSMISMFYWHLLTPFAQSSGPGSLGPRYFELSERWETRRFHRIPTRAWVIFIIPFLAEQRSVTPCDTHTHKDHKDKKRETHLDHLQDLEISLHVPISLQLVQVLTQSKRTLEHLATS